MTTQSEASQTNHHRAVRFFWVFLICASLVSLVGNIAHAVLPLIPHVLIQIGAAAVPPIALLAAVHGVALAVRAGASGRMYHWAVVAVSAIGVGAFSVSFLALCDLMQSIGYSPGTASIFPAIIDTTVAVSTMMLVALGDKPARRVRGASASVSAPPRQGQGTGMGPAQSAKTEVRPAVPDNERVQTTGPSGRQIVASVQPDPAREPHSTQTETAQADADLASELLASGVTTQPFGTVIAILEAHRKGSSTNAAAKAAGINYRTAQRIVEAAAARQQRQLAATG